MNRIAITFLLTALVSASSSVLAAANPKFGALNPAETATKPVAADMTLPMPKGLKGDITEGRDFYMQNCFTCHGVTGAGDGPRAYFINPVPRDFLLETSRQYLNRPALFEAISNGRTGSEMPAWSRVLNDQEIANVAEYVFQSFIMAGKKRKGSSGK
jgi:mono/diheme cytochrome c family protein